MIKIALSGIVGFALGATVTSIPVIGHHDKVAIETHASDAVDPFAMMKDAKKLPETEVWDYF